MGFIHIYNNQKLHADGIFYQIGKVFWFPFCLVGFWFAHGGYERYGEITACSIRRMCGLPCPGCGGTRAFYYLFLGNFKESLYLNPAVIYGVLAYLHFMLLYFYRKHFGGRKGWSSPKEIPIQYYMYVAIVVILGQWAVKIIKILSFL
ncbi:MAG: DUF2752 domain-containing protein [Lachnospiraceae bacterium]|nr:DUF2752 domain-containing protein [Lachnospiraceae bacterium]